MEVTFLCELVSQTANREAVRRKELPIHFLLCQDI